MLRGVDLPWIGFYLARHNQFFTASLSVYGSVRCQEEKGGNQSEA